jgi:hypothetical protein
VDGVDRSRFGPASLSELAPSARDCRDSAGRSDNSTISAEEWTKFIKLMPVPDLVPTVGSSRRNRAGFFDELLLVDPSNLGPRMACLSRLGEPVAAALGPPRSRVVVETHRYNEVTCGPYEEADITEDWCEERMPDGLTHAPVDTVRRASSRRACPS